MSYPFPLKRTLVVLAAVCITLAAPAHADADADYLRVLHAGGIGLDAPPSLLIKLGHDICGFFGKGLTFDNIVTVIERAGEQGNISELVDPIGAKYLVDTAVNIYCPQYRSQLTTSTGTTTSTTTPPPRFTPEEDQVFLDRLRSHDFDIPDPAKAVAIGHESCNKRRQGEYSRQIDDELSAEYEMTGPEVAMLSADAMLAYPDCYG